MISGGSLHNGGPALAVHLLSDDNDSVVMSSRRGVLADDLPSAILEMRAGASTRCKKALYHAHCDPAGDRQAEQMAAFWQRFEAEFGLENHAFAEVLHEKNGRAHSHRVYERLGPDGRLEHFRHDRARREKIGRQIEAEFGQQLTPGPHSRAVVTALQVEGDHALATRLAALSTPAPGVAVSPQERQQGERTGWSRHKAEASALRAWESSLDRFVQHCIERRALFGRALCT